ncbi:MAG: alpha/beta hydrolase fold domain-containing protein [Planctomycetes bacterium]|nr:alpha/beta hydrolase fold domain-containing protein [Planctomycetota bacterium]
MLAVVAAFAASTVLLAPQQPTTSGGPDLVAALTKAVDLPTAAERQAAVKELLALDDHVDRWLEICRSFGTFAQLEPGLLHREVELRVLDRVEKTQLYLYVPKSYDPSKPAPLLLWGHGSGGSGDQQHTLWAPVAEQLGMLVLSPTDPNTDQGYSKEPRERAAALAALRWAKRTCNVDENAVFVGGWSRGGHLAWDLALRYPDLWAGMIPVVGGPLLSPGATSNMRYLENVVPLAIRDLQGSLDDPTLLLHLHITFDKLKKWKAANVELIEFPEQAHGADLDAVDWPPFFAARRDPHPKHVVRVAAVPDEARTAWVEITQFTKSVSIDGAPEVSASAWNRLDDAHKRAYLVDAYAKLTARIDITDRGNGRFAGTGDQVHKLTLWLEKEQLGKDGKVELRVGSKTHKKIGVPAAEVLLRDFVERLDRTRLPVARIDVP